MKKTFLLLSLLVLFAVNFTSCKPEKDENEVEEVMEEAGDKAGEAVEEAGDAVEDAADEMDN